MVELEDVGSLVFWLLTPIKKFHDRVGVKKKREKREHKAPHGTHGHAHGTGSAGTPSTASTESAGSNLVEFPLLVVTRKLLDNRKTTKTAKKTNKQKQERCWCWVVGSRSCGCVCCEDYD